jgi:hypothetical protein
MKDYTRVPLPGQGIDVMGTRIWNENLAAFWVQAPLVAPEPTIDAPVACDRESEAAAW